MALKVYNGTNWDDTFGSASIGGTNVTVTAAGITSLGNTAPNTTNQAMGVLLAIVSTPTTASYTVQLLESGVVKASGTVNLADFRLGYIYVRFTTPYKFTTTSAGAYTIKVISSSGSQGTLRCITSGNLWNLIVYDTGTTLGATDDAWIGGFVNAGITSKTLTISGTSNSWGSGADNAMVSTTTWSMGAATTIFNGGSLVFDTTASTTLTQLGSIMVHRNGLFDMRANASDITKINTLSFNQQATDGRFGIMHPPSNVSGQILTTGMTVPVYTTYSSGLGTAASPVVTGSAHGLSVNDEIVIGGATDYSKNEKRYIISIPTSTQLVLSNTLGGSENALTQTHAAGAYIGNLTRNSIINNTTTTAGFWILNFDTNTSPVSSYDYTRLEYPNCLSGKGISMNGGSSTTQDGNDATHDGLVVYHNSAAARTSINLTGKAAQTITGVILYNTRGTNYAAQSGYVLQSASNKTINYLLHFADPSSTTNCAGLSLSGAVSNTLNHYHSYGANASNGGLGYSMGIFSSFNNTFNNSTIDSSRICGLYYSSSLNNTFNNCNFGVVGTNAVDIFTVSATYNTALFNTCYFSSATLISNYLNQLDGSDIAIQDMDANTSKHRWYTNRGSFWSSGSGLTETTVRTASSLALAIKPENSSSGAEMYFKLPANPASNVQVYGYIYRNATFSSGDITCDLFLPGTLLTATPDATVTLSTTTLTWQLWKLNAYYSGSVARYATVRIRAKTATAGAVAFLDDIYDAALNNKVAGMDLWDEGHISPIMLALDLSAVPEQTRVAVWSDDDTYGAGEKGTVLKDAKDNAEAAAYEMYK